MKRISLKGIPKQHHRAIRAYLGISLGMGGKQLSPQEAYKALQAQWKDEAEQAEQRKQEQQAEAEKNRADDAKQEADRAIRKLAHVRDFLLDMERGGHDLFCLEDAAMFARALLAEAGAQLEQALFTLGVVEGTDGPKGGEGWFVESLK
jgi:hypothetical protein